MKKILLILMFMSLIINCVFADDDLRSLRIEKIMLKSHVKQRNNIGFNVTAVVITGGLKNKNLELTITFRYPNGKAVDGPTGVLKGDVDKNGHLRKKVFLKCPVDNKPINYSFFYPYSFFKHGLKSEFIVTCKFEYDVLMAKSELQFRYDYQKGVIPTRSIGIKGTEYKRVEKKWYRPDHVAVAVARPNIEEYEINMDLHASIVANGLKGQKIFLGSGFKNLKGSFLMPSIMAPQENYGNRGRIQFQTPNTIKFDRAKWNDFTLKIPCKWIKFKHKNKKKYIATTYVVSGGLWIFSDKEIYINPEKQVKKIILRDYLGNESEFKKTSSSAKLLFRAVEKGDLNSAKFLLENTDDIDNKNESGETPLHIASKKGNIEMAKLLIDSSMQSEGSSGKGGVNAIDHKGNTPLHYAVLKDDVKMTKFLISKGSRPDIKNVSGHTAISLAKLAKAKQVVSEDDDLDEKLYTFRTEKIRPLPTLKKPVSKYLVMLRGHDQEFKKQRTIFESIKNKPLNNEISDYVKSVINSGLLYAETMKLFIFDKYTRSGLMEEHEIIKRIRENVEIIGKIYKEKTGKKLPAEISDMKRQNRNTELVMAARMILKKKIGSFLKKKGLMDLLQSKHYKVASNRVQQVLGINIQGYLERLSKKHLGMGLGGFKSAKAAFRLQCRRIIKEKIADIILSFSGSGLLIKIAQRVILEWLENNFWPKLREGFRPKTKLARRVSISINGLMDAREQLINTVGTGNPSEIPVNNIIREIQNIRGKLAAMRYLKKDLSRTDEVDLKDDVAALEKIITRDLRRIDHQFLLDQQERNEEIIDNVKWTFGILDEIHKISKVKIQEKAALRVVQPNKRSIDRGYLSKGTGYSIPYFKLFSEVPRAVKAGLYKMEVASSSGVFYFYGRKHSTHHIMTFNGPVPIPDGPFSLNFSIPELDCIRPLLFKLSKKNNEKEKKLKHIESLKKAVKSFQKKLNHPKETVRKRNMGNIAERYNSMGRAFLYCDDVASAKKLFEAAYKTLKQGRILDNYRILSSTWDGLSYVAFKSNNVKEFINCRLNYIKNRKMIIQKDSIKAHYTNKDSDFSNLGDYYLKTADWALVLGASPKSITPYFEEAKKLKKVKTKDIKKLIYHHPNLKAVFGNF